MPIPATGTDLGNYGPAINGLAIAAGDDNNDLSFITRAIYVGVTGNITLILQGDTAPVTLLNVPVGLYPFAVSRIYSTGLTASSIVALR